MEDKKIELLDRIKADRNTLTVATVAEIFVTTFFGCIEKTNSGKKIKEKLTEPEFVKFANGMTDSFLSSIYGSASKNEEEFQERIAFLEEVHADTEVRYAEKAKVQA